MLRPSLIAALLFTAVAAPLGAQRTTPSYASEAERARADEAAIASEAFALSNDQAQRMTVMVNVGGKGPYAFLVDTGSERTAISRQLASLLKLPGGVPARVHSVLGTETVETVNIPHLGVGDRTLSVVDAPTFEAQHIGAAGILGIDSLRSQRVVFDFKAREMRIAPSQYDGVGRLEKDTIVVRARARKGRLILTSVTLDGLPIAAIIDTGAQVSVGNLPLLRKLQRTSPVRTEQVTVNLQDQLATLEAVTGQVKSVNIARVQRLDLGGMQLQEVTVAFANARIFRELGYSTKPAILLGMDALRSFDKVTIDFAGKKVRFESPAA